MIDIASLAYKPGWRFRLGGPGNRSLCIYACTPDSWHPDQPRLTQHQFEIPEGLTDRDWICWWRDCLRTVEQHEVDEFAAVDGHRVFYPHHNNEGSPYEYVERWEGTPWDSSL